jgi:hypothetical protein
VHFQVKYIPRLAEFGFHRAAPAALPCRPARPSGDNINRSAVAKYLYKTKYYTIISVSNRRF